MITRELLTAVFGGEWAGFDRGWKQVSTQNRIVSAPQHGKPRYLLLQAADVLGLGAKDVTDQIISAEKRNAPKTGKGEKK